MTKKLTVTGFVVGLIYGGGAAGLVYSESPLALQLFISAGVAAIGASAGWMFALVFRASLPRIRGVRR